jgi:hypothetical protein
VTQDQAADGGGVSGGAIDVEFFGYLANGSSALTVAQSSFTGNQALGGDGGQGSGGAIAVEGPDSTSATVTDSSFVGNEARGGNGGFGDGFLMSCRRDQLDDLRVAVDLACRAAVEQVLGDFPMRWDVTVFDKVRPQGRRPHVSRFEDEEGRPLWEMLQSTLQRIYPRLCSAHPVWLPVPFSARE